MPFDIDFNLVMSASRDHITNVRSLIIRGADVNAASPEGVTSLMYAADIGDLEMVKLLLENGASANTQPTGGITALMSATLQNHFEVAEYLVTHSANPDLRDANGITAANYAAAYNYFEILDMLIYYKADVDIADYEGNTPLISAAFNNCAESAEILLKNGADINKQDNNGFTPLMTSIQRGNKDIARLLIAHDADISKVNSSGMTALAFAVKASDYDLTEELIRKDADINYKVSGGRNILELARENKDEDILELLTSEGARPNNYPDFNLFAAGVEMSFNSGDFTTGVNFGLVDTKYHFCIDGGFIFRPVAVRVLRDESPVLSNQYWERRYYFYLGVKKSFPVIKLNNGFATGPVLGVDEIYTFGNYRGSTSKPESSFITVPEVGWYVANSWISVGLNYKYMNLDTDYISPGRISIDIDFMLPLRQRTMDEKHIRWLTN